MVDADNRLSFARVEAGDDAAFRVVVEGGPGAGGLPFGASQHCHRPERPRRVLSRAAVNIPQPPLASRPDCWHFGAVR